jgi:phage major head subunit gpT-like protein
MNAQVKHIQIVDRQAGRLVETSFDPIDHLYESLAEGFAARYGNKRRFSMEEAWVASPDAANLLRDGIRFLAFNAYREMPAEWERFTLVQNSDKPQEEYLLDGSVGTFPRVKSGEAVPTVISGFDRGVTIKNYQYAGLAEIVGDDIRFDRLGKIRQIAPLLGRAARQTETEAVYEVITSTGNYTRSATAGDNDGNVGNGANTQTLTFNAANLQAAKIIVGTAKDRKSGAYLGFNPDTLIVPPGLEVAAKQLLLSDTVMRVGGNTTNETIGNGTTNPYFNMISNIIVSPWFGAKAAGQYSWALCDSSVQGLVFQRVAPFNIMEENQGMTSESYITRDVIRYKAMGYFGTGMVDDRAWFYSNSTTAPTVS